MEKFNYQVVFEINFDNEKSNVVFTGLTDSSVIVVMANCTDVMLKAFSSEDFKIVNVVYSPLNLQKNES